MPVNVRSSRVRPREVKLHGWQIHVEELTTGRAGLLLLEPPAVEGWGVPASLVGSSPPLLSSAAL